MLERGKNVYNFREFFFSFNRIHCEESIGQKELHNCRIWANFRMCTAMKKAEVCVCVFVWISSFIYLDGLRYIQSMNLFIANHEIAEKNLFICK